MGPREWWWWVWVLVLLFCDWPTAQVLDDDQEYALGVLEIPLCQILPYTDLTLEQRFQLDHSGLDSLISMRLVLRVTISSCSLCSMALAMDKADYLRTKYLLFAEKLGNRTIFFINFGILSAIISSDIGSPFF